MSLASLFCEARDTKFMVEAADFARGLDRNERAIFGVMLCGGEEVEIEVEKNQIIIRPAQNVREGWDAAFKAMDEKGDDEPLNYEGILNVGDEEDWQW